jgi:hypothetical protein
VKQFFKWLAIVTFALLSSSVVAHKMKSAFSIVLFNERTGNIEVMHRFVLHDAEEGVWQLFDAKADIIADDKTQSKFADYVETKFEIKDQNNKTLPLEMVGYQNDAGYFWVYQEIKNPKGLTKLTIRSDALREIWTEQYNIVNIEGNGPTTSLHFSDSDKWRSVSF